MRRRAFLKQVLLSYTAFMVGCNRNSNDPVLEVESQITRSGRLAPYSGLSLPQRASLRQLSFPLHREPKKRYLIDAQGYPVFLHGDTAWSLLVQLTSEETNQYLEDRRLRGFNVVLVNLLEHQYALDPPRNRYGDAPFTSIGDYSTPNEKYFAHVDWVVQKAAEKGILVMLAPSYIGSMNDGWYQSMVKNGSSVLYNFGRYLGQRYQNLKNIMWVHGGDSDPSDPDLVSQIAIGIRDFDKISLHTAHAGRERPAMDFWRDASWMQINNVYTYEPVFEICKIAYTHFDQMPFFLIEGKYENERGASDTLIRAQAWYAVLSGAMGQLMGNNPIWHFDCPTPLSRYSLTWRESLNSEGARSMTQLRQLLNEYPWWEIEPDFNNSLLQGGTSAGDNKAVAACSSDGTFAFAYVPTNRVIKLNLGRLVGPRVNAHWYDPVVGKFIEIPKISINSGRQLSLRPPFGGNGGGDEDWVLVLESTI